MIIRILLYVIITMMSVNISSIHQSPESCADYKKPGQHVADFVKEIFYDVGQMYKNMVHWDTVKIFAGMFPLYITGAIIDDKKQHCTYDPKHHKNIHQMPDDWHKFADVASVSAVAAVAVGNYLFLPHERLKQTSWMFLWGLPFIIWTTDIFKHFAKFEACCRPWNGQFSCKERSYGGFPSTHGAQLAYATALFGLQFGPKAAFPLGVFTAAVGASAINGNRHYVAQYIAGVTLGMIYGFAASKVVDNKISNWSCGVDVDHNCNPAVKLSYAF